MSRDELRRTGEEMRRRLGQTADAPGALGRSGTAPGFGQLVTEAVYGSIWARPGLALGERLVCALGACGLQPPSAQLDALVAAALEAGLAPRGVLEVFVQCGLYGGFVRTELACERAHEVFRARGVEVPGEPAREESLEWLDARGEEVMRRLHGERAGAGYASPDRPASRTLYAAAIRFGYGDLWSRPGLAFRERLLCALAAFTVLGLESQLAKFARAALDNDFTREAIAEAVIQTAPYGGFPRALNALALLDDL